MLRKYLMCSVSPQPIQAVCGRIYYVKEAVQLREDGDAPA